MQGENPLECAKRELREETGILIDDFIEVGRVLHQKHQTYYVNYLCHTDVDKDSIVWYYFDENGRVVTGDQEINVQELILMKMVFKLKADLLQTLKVTNTLTMQKLVTWKMKMALL